MAAGLISEHEFMVFARQFVDVSNKMQDAWELRHSSVDKDNVFMYKKESKLVLKIQDTKKPTPREDLQSQQLEEVDPSCVTFCNEGEDTTSMVYVYEFHVIYSSSYNVPVLYFNAYKPDGSLVSLEEIWCRVPAHYRQKLEEEKWSFLTQQEHPLLGRPFYQLHPCHTADLMKQVQDKSSHSDRNYLITWLSAVGPVVGLDLSLEYGKIVNTNVS